MRTGRLESLRPAVGRAPGRWASRGLRGRSSRSPRHCASRADRARFSRTGRTASSGDRRGSAATRGDVSRRAADRSASREPPPRGAGRSPSRERRAPSSRDNRGRPPRGEPDRSSSDHRGRGALARTDPSRRAAGRAPSREPPPRTAGRAPSRASRDQSSRTGRWPFGPGPAARCLAVDPLDFFGPAPARFGRAAASRFGATALTESRRSRLARAGLAAWAARACARAFFLAVLIRGLRAGCAMTPIQDRKRVCGWAARGNKNTTRVGGQVARD